MSKLLGIKGRDRVSLKTLRSLVKAAEGWSDDSRVRFYKEEQLPTLDQFKTPLPVKQIIVTDPVDEAG